MKTAKELFSLDGKIAIVTGGRGLYGASISEGLCEMGATVVIASRSGDKCEEFAQTLRGKGYSAIGLSLDLSDDASIKALAKDVHDRYGRIDILVNNAVDRRNMTPLAAATRQKLQDSASTNLNGQILLSQAVLEYMVPQESGSIINISSMRGLDSPHFPFYPPAMGDQPVNYTTEKWAMIGLTKYMAGTGSTISASTASPPAASIPVCPTIRSAKALSIPISQTAPSAAGPMRTISRAPSSSLPRRRQTM